VKVGDLVRFYDGYDLENNFARYRTKGIILSLDKDNDPVVFWLDSSFFGQIEANFRKHIVVLSEC
tara:strand:- start:15 stop:209 length:195 start_codon:yes stop_codon:yes gene_type:complete